MRKFFFIYLLIVAAHFCTGQEIHTAKIDGSINPVTAEFITKTIRKAADDKAAAILITLNTPGGLFKSTRIIVSEILESPVPVIVYVAPGGSHAGSAGVFITLAAHIAAMAPGTNIGAAHPVGMGQQADTVMGEKMTNDAAAFIKSIAKKRNRNVEWAENAVRRSSSYTESEALESNVIDLIAKNTDELLQRIDGRTLETSAGEVTLRTTGATMEDHQMSWIQRLLNVISDPNIAYILFMIGLYGIMFELFSPGAIFPGIAGVICLILGFYALNTLPINYAALALIIFGVILFILEVKVTSHGLLTIGGVISMLIGSLMLIESDSDMDLINISRSVIIATVAVSALFFLFVVGAGLRAQKAKPFSGSSAMVGEIGEAIDKLDPVGMVRVHGELWNATASEGAILPGQKIRVKEVKDLKLLVESI